jgi:hypothetical protein
MKKVYWIIGIIFLGVVIFGQHRKIRNLRFENQIQAVELSFKENEILIFETKNGDLVNKLNAVEVDRKNLKAGLEAAEIDIKELKEMNINYKNIIATLSLKIESLGSGQTTVTDTFKIVETDTIYFQKVQDWNNGYLNLFNAQIEKGQFDFNYKYNTGINIFQENRKKDVVVTVQLADPNASIISGNSITISNKKKFYEKPVIWGVAGFLGGYLITK